MHKGERVNWKWGKAINAQRQPPATHFSKTIPPEGSTAFLNKTTSWGPSIQIHEPVGTFLLQTTYPTPSLLLLSLKASICLLLLTYRYSAVLPHALVSPVIFHVSLYVPSDCFSLLVTGAAPKLLSWALVCPQLYPAFSVNDYS